MHCSIKKPSSPIPPAADISIRKPILPLEVLEHRAMNMHPELKRLDAKMAVNTAQVTLAEKDFLSRTSIYCRL